jgi:DNA-binding transcriptional regulator GbsR (MarR family)
VDLARVAVLTGERLTVREIAEETGMSKSRVSRLQAKARELGMAAEANGA